MISVEKNRVQLGHSLAVGGVLVFDDVLQNHVHVVIEACQSADDLLVVLHYHPDFRADALVNELQWEKCVWADRKSQYKLQTLYLAILQKNNSCSELLVENWHVVVVLGLEQISEDWSTELVLCDEIGSLPSSSFVSGSVG